MKYLSFAVIFLALTVAASAAFADNSVSPWGDLSTVIDATQKGSHSIPNPGDGIYTPHVSQVAAVDKTIRPFTAWAPVQEPAFANIVAANKPTGDSYIMKFPNATHGGGCNFDGSGRYYIESTGALKFQIGAQCGDLRRGYDFEICMLSPGLHCAEAPFWNFRGQVYAISTQGVTVNQTLHPWDNPAEAADKLQKLTVSLQRMKNTYNNPNAPNVMHARVIACRHYQPEQKKYIIVEIMTGCVIKSLCSGDMTPDLSTLHDGDPINWGTPTGNYIKQQEKITDASNWVCWLRTQ